MFNRSFSEDAILALKEEPLFKEYLMPDIVGTFSGKELNRDVFPAIRKDRIDFYHRGGRLFSFKVTEGFNTHQKYASILQSPSKDYLRESDLNRVQHISKFSDEFAYGRIKENCALYAGDEAEGVSHLYNRFSCVKKKMKSEIVVLDIEISFKNDDYDDHPEVDRKGSKKDRIDFLLFHTRKRELRFYESKLFSNGDIRAKDGETPKILRQMERYRKQLDTEIKRNNILEQYRKHVLVLNTLFNRELPIPSVIDPEPRLFIFDFDGDQKKGKLKNNLKTLLEADISAYAYGDPNSNEFKIQELWGK